MRNVRVKKHLGQHFLNNKDIAKNITDLLINNKQLIIEVGPGMGMLTRYLLEKKNDLELIEVDKECVSYLELKYPQLEKKITADDFLKIKLHDKYQEPFSLIGNFPYNISSQILFKVLENKEKITEVIGMFQKEVGERIVSKKGKSRGILSVLIQAFYKTEYCFTVNQEEFTPQPKVKSAVIRLIRNTKKNLDCDEGLFKQIVKTSFNQRRKTLKNALKSFSLTNKLIKNNLLQKRAEELSVEDFILITLSCQRESK